VNFTVEMSGNCAVVWTSRCTWLIFPSRQQFVVVLLVSDQFVCSWRTPKG